MNLFELLNRCVTTVIFGCPLSPMAKGGRSELIEFLGG